MLTLQSFTYSVTWQAVLGTERYVLHTMDSTLLLVHDQPLLFGICTILCELHTVRCSSLVVLLAAHCTALALLVMFTNRGPVTELDTRKVNVMLAVLQHVETGPAGP